MVGCAIEFCDIRMGEPIPDIDFAVEALSLCELLDFMLYDKRREYLSE